MSRAGRLLQERNVRGDVLKTWSHQLPLALLKLTLVPVVTAGAQLRHRRSRELGRDGPAFRTSRSACLAHLEVCSGALKIGTRASGRVWCVSPHWYGGAQWTVDGYPRRTTQWFNYVQIFDGMCLGAEY
ncbi:hypothetical protein H4582DRAFT_1964974 [Lactarius indigo]|nr:hypothetical protein H4582DRAFT_1964974 [Lactarius indigo]